MSRSTAARCPPVPKTHARPRPCAVTEEGATERLTAFHPLPSLRRTSSESEPKLRPHPTRAQTSNDPLHITSRLARCRVLYTSNFTTVHAGTFKVASCWGWVLRRRRAIKCARLKRSAHPRTHTLACGLEARRADSRTLPFHSAAGDETFRPTSLQAVGVMGSCSVSGHPFWRDGEEALTVWHYLRTWDGWQLVEVGRCSTEYPIPQPCSPAALQGRHSHPHIICSAHSVVLHPHACTPAMHENAAMHHASRHDATTHVLLPNTCI